MAPRKVLFKLFEAAYFAALLIAYLSLFRLAFETAYILFLMEPYR